MVCEGRHRLGGGLAGRVGSVEQSRPPVVYLQGMSRAALNPRRRPDAHRVTGQATEFHRRLPGYGPTPLHSLPALAAELGIAALHVKDESDRLGLPAFKILGASWAIYRLLCKRLGGEPPGWESTDELAEAFAALHPLTLDTATDGNHGRAVARAARWFGCDARIFVPEATARSRIDAIAGEGAAVEVVDGTYDDAVARAAGSAGEHAVVVSDTSWPGYTEVPGWVAEGYETICAEVDAALTASGLQLPTHVFVQVGVGALAVAMVRHYAPGARVIGLEPDGAACCYESVVAGEPVVVPGPHTSIMSGMNCGTVSLIAWPELRDGLAAVMTLDDNTARDAMRRLAVEGIVSGETGAAGVGAVMELLTNHLHREVREGLHLGAGSRVLALSTEGATDPENFARIVGRSAEAVTAG